MGGTRHRACWLDLENFKMDKDGENTSQDSVVIG
jgi:hypothetical protein